MKIQDIPQFGNLADVQVVFTGQNVACPFAAQLLAEQGARTVCLENSKSPDPSRRGGLGFVTERKNMLDISLALGTPEGNEAFMKLMETTDIFMEGNKGGAMAKLGLSDEALWAVNPKLVIVHISGYGQTGVPEYVARPSYDPIGQAYGGIMALNGDPDRPMRVQPMVSDYIPALFACWSSLAALVGARSTGKGESIDVSQFETTWKIQYDYTTRFFRDGIVPERTGGYDPNWAGAGLYECADEPIMLALVGPQIHRCRQVVGYDNPEFDQYKLPALSRKDPIAMRFDAYLCDWLKARPAAEAEKAFQDAQIPCSRIYDIAKIVEDPHAQARELFVEWDDVHYGKMKGVNVVPKMGQRPGEYWKGAPMWGEDNDDILAELGYSAEEIDALYEKGIVVKTPDHGGYFA